MAWTVGPLSVEMTHAPGWAWPRASAAHHGPEPPTRPLPSALTALDPSERGSGRRALIFAPLESRSLGGDAVEGPREPPSHLQRRMSTGALPPATPPTHKPPRVTRPRPPSRPRASSPARASSPCNGRPSLASGLASPMPSATPPPRSPHPPGRRSPPDPASPCSSPLQAPRAVPFPRKAPDPQGPGPGTPKAKIPPPALGELPVRPPPSPRAPSPHLRSPPPPPSPRPPRPSPTKAPSPRPSVPGTVRRLAGRFEQGPGPSTAEKRGNSGSPRPPLSGPDGGASGPGAGRGLGRSEAEASQENGLLDAPSACPSPCPCACHRAHPGMELRWVTAAGDGEGASWARRPSRSRPAPPSPLLNGHPPVVLTSYRSTAEPAPPLPLKPPKPTRLGPRPGALQDPPRADRDPTPEADHPGINAGEPRPTSPRGTPPERPQETPTEKEWGLPLQDEPLYQTYRAAVLSEELWGGSEDGAPPSPGPGDPPCLPRPPGPRNTLWQELPAVQASGLLQSLDPQERRMQESLFEVVASEASYLRSLRLLTETFVLSPSLRDTLTPRDHHTLFSSVQRVQAVSERFLSALLARVSRSPHIADVCDVVLSHAQGPFSVYVDYVRNQQYQEETYSRLMETNSRFSAELARLQNLPLCQRLPLPSFLLLPFQRITRLRMLLQNILRQAEEGSSREENARQALGAVSKIIERCNAEVGRMKQTEELIRLSQRLRFHKVKALPLVSWSRRLELQGELTELGRRGGGTLFGSRPRLTPLCLLLFSDLLLVTLPKSGQRLQVLDYAHRSLVQAQPLPVPPGPPTFRLTLLSNHQGRPTHRLLQAPTLSDMQRWLGAFPAPGPQPGSPDTIYEDWDCPQVLCLEPHTAEEPEGLSLEPGDLVNVLRKSREGWLEGVRPSDGRRGRFPAQSVREVPGEHVRRRHLRQRQLLLQAAGRLCPPPAPGTPRTQRGGPS
ncbi:rho guanine nucleotide exchange factor 15 [Ornithorhynchus anatinus]|uniref:rho guanine nucleotide exchange factor 15 n=1 Tax=Ornithorhynchus anatinus TaxID=9258 RepID=UPI0010A827CA|nr:rho guanine nucleotide exchange factor 15 [Ornithorhynchus anatinus]